MPVLFLGPSCPRLLDFLEVKGEIVQTTSERVRLEDLEGFEVLISYGYRYLISPQVLALFPDKAINLHISYLPWNRGADPNFWSFFDSTPKGVTLHHLDATLDTGDIIAQRLVPMSDDETMASSYAKLKDAVESLFEENWENFRNGRCRRIPQVGPGSSHRSSDKNAHLSLLESGWDTRTSIVEAHGARLRSLSH